MTKITDRIDNTTRIPESHLVAAPPAPRSVKIGVSPRCGEIFEILDLDQARAG